MPLPESKDVGLIMRFLKKDKPNMARKQKIAIAVNQARKSGARIKKKRSVNDMIMGK